MKKRFFRSENCIRKLLQIDQSRKEFQRIPQILTNFQIVTDFVNVFITKKHNRFNRLTDIIDLFGKTSETNQSTDLNCKSINLLKV